MAETATRPTRTRKPAATPAKADTPAKPKAAPATAKAPTAAPAGESYVGEDGRRRVPVQLDFLEETKSYAVFVPPKASGCVGKYYAPKGTEEVKVLLIGPAE